MQVCRMSEEANSSNRNQESFDSFEDRNYLIASDGKTHARRPTIPIWEFFHTPGCVQRCRMEEFDIVRSNIQVQCFQSLERQFQRNIRLAVITQDF